jgi:aldehyde dehydrogenase (NAD+)
MGGQNPSIVLPDADVKQAAATIASAAMGYAGQKCTATSRAIVVGDATEFTAALADAVETLGVGDPAEQGISVGPVITDDARGAVVQAAEQVRADGGRVVCGGKPLDRDGYFVAPTVVDGIDAGHHVAQEEVFGPICAVLPASSTEDAVTMANGVRYGLAAAIFTSDLQSALDLSGRLDAGLVKVNAATSGVDFYAPFGGEKASSYGPREQGKAAREFYTAVHTVTLVGR